MTVELWAKKPNGNVRIFNDVSTEEKDTKIFRLMQFRQYQFS